MTIPEHRLSAWRAHRTEGAHLLFAPSLGNLIGPESASFIGGGGTVAKVAAQPAVRVAVTDTSGDLAAYLSRESYRPGFGGARYSCALYWADAGQTAQNRKWGRWSGDGDEGVYFKLSGTALSLVRGSKATGSTVYEEIGSASWNGTRPANFDVTKLHRYEIELGPCGARAFIDDVLVHTFAKEGVLAEAISRAAGLPFVVIIENTGASVASSVTVLDPTVVVHGDLPTGPSFMHAAQAALSGGGVALLSVRPKASVGGLGNSASIHPTRLVCLAGTEACIFRVRVGATLTAPTWADVDATSVVEVDVVGTVSGGVQVAELALGPLEGGQLDLREVFGWRRRSLAVPISQTPTGDILTVVGLAGTGTPTGRAALHWNEVR